MPSGDRSGPTGMGPMTGWGMGYCTRRQLPGSTSFRSHIQRRHPRNRGEMGRKMAFRFHDFSEQSYDDSVRSYITPYHSGQTLEEEWEWLQNELGFMENRLKDIKTRIRELETERAER